MGEITHSTASTKPATCSDRIVVDLTHSLVSSEVPACDGHPKYAACCLSHVSRGDVSTCHSLTMGTHTGTHIDAPYHFIENGTTVDKLDLSLLTAAPAVVVDLRWKKAREPIHWEDFAKYESRLREGVALLLCTGWSKNWKTSRYAEHPFLDVGAAIRIMEKGVRVIGVDTMSPDEIGEEGDTGRVHREWLGAGGIIVENINGLERILELGTSNDLRVSLLPLNLVDCDGSPIRAVAWEER
ncbi:putative cyclase [Irpex lacteus]|nr:putative cyclase [Irpex lacteus]